jgi:hypothetical protein
MAGLPGRFHPQFRDKNRRDIGKSQSIWTDSKMETPGSRGTWSCPENVASTARLYVCRRRRSISTQHGTHLAQGGARAQRVPPLHSLACSHQPRRGLNCLHTRGGRSLRQAQRNASCDHTLPCQPATSSRTASVRRKCVLRASRTKTGADRAARASVQAIVHKDDDLLTHASGVVQLLS